MKSFLSLLFLLGFNFLFGQVASEKAITIHQPQKFWLEGTTKAILGSNSKIILDVQLPPNTIKWYYSFRAKKRTKTNISIVQRQISMFSQLTNVIDRTGTTNKALSLLSAPPGEDYCDTYLLSSLESARTFPKKVPIKGFSYNRVGSRKNLKQGIVEITNPIRCIGTQYIGIKNPNKLYGIGVEIEVVAIIQTEWSSERRQEIHDAISSLFKENNNFGLDDFDVFQLVTCMVNGFTSEYSQEEARNMAEYEISNNFEPILKGCSVNLELDNSEEEETMEDKPNPLESTNPIIELSRDILVGAWKDENSSFVFYENGDINIKYDNLGGTWGKWKIENGDLYIQFKSSEPYTRLKIIEFSEKDMKYHAVGDKIIYSANKIY